MTQKEFEKQCPLYPAFPNYTKAIYEGNKPCGKGHKLTIGGYTDRWECLYGGGETNGERILHVTFQINKKVTIYIINDHLRIVDIRYNGKNDVWEYTNDNYLKNPCLNPKTTHKLETEKINNILNADIDCVLWGMVKKRAMCLLRGEL